MTALAVKSVRRALPALLAACLCVSARAQDVRLPLKSGSLRLAIVGDTGTASREQNEVGLQMALYRAKFPFELVVMLGDNIYGSDSANDFKRKFELPYKELLDAGVKFYASLGNHDNPSQASYKLFNMGGQRFYTFKPQQGVRLFAIDSNYVDKKQLDWLEKELAASGSEWKICFFHHPLYSSGKRHGSSLDLRKQLEPLFIQYGVNVVLSGHDHIYERTKPQSGVYYFVSGSAGALRKGNYGRQPFSETGFDQDFHFMLAEIDGDDFHFQAVTRTGKVVDSGVLHRPKATTAPSAPPPAKASPAPSPSASPAAKKRSAKTRRKAALERNPGNLERRPREVASRLTGIRGSRGAPRRAYADAPGRAASP
jgi:3',5'-cyclic AMP phosphodiesterase CpdA